jgi:DivIVA domain-containing protein
MAADERHGAEPPAAAPKAQPPLEDPEEIRGHVPADIRNVTFPVSVRGYDRNAVDGYVKRVNRVIAELEISRSPESAVRHALDRVGKQTVAVLQEARESADKLLEAARDEADAEKERAKAEAAKLVVSASDEADRTTAEADKVHADAKAQAAQIVSTAQAEANRHKRETEKEIASLRAQAEKRMREIHTDTQAVWKERARLLDETHAMARKLQELAAGAAARIGGEAPAAASGDEQPTQITEPQERKRQAKPAG